MTQKSNLYGIFFKKKVLKTLKIRHLYGFKKAQKSDLPCVGAHGRGLSQCPEVYIWPSNGRHDVGHGFYQVGHGRACELMSMTELYNLCDGTIPWDLRSLLIKSSSLFSGALHRLRTLRGIQELGINFRASQ